MPQPKIAFFVPSMRGGGVERVTLILAKRIADKGYTVDLLLVSAQGPFMKSIPNNINIVDFGKSRSIATVVSLSRYLRREKPEILCCTMSHLGFVGVLARILARSGVRIFVQVRNTLSLALQQDFKYWKRTILYWLTRFLASRNLLLIPVSHGVADDLREHFHIPATKIHVIYNPVIRDTLKIEMNKPCEHKWLQEKTIPVVLAVGRMVPQKGFDTLLHAFKEVVNHRSARLIILGEGSRRGLLESLKEELQLDDCVDMPGFADNPYSYMKNANLFVLSSTFEGLPNVLIEAVGCGCPIVSTDCPSGPKEILDNGKYGKLVPVNDPKALAVAILESLEEDHNPLKLLERAELFSEDRSVEQYLSVFLSEENSL